MNAAGLGLSDSFVWLVMYGAAASGWMICAATPTLARFCLELQANNKRRALEVLGTASRREWGDAVAGGQKQKGQPATDAEAAPENRPQTPPPTRPRTRRNTGAVAAAVTA